MCVGVCVRTPVSVCLSVSVRLPACLCMSPRLSRHKNGCLFGVSDNVSVRRFFITGLIPVDVQKFLHYLRRLCHPFSLPCAHKISTTHEQTDIHTLRTLHTRTHTTQRNRAHYIHTRAHAHAHAHAHTHKPRTHTHTHLFPK